MVWLYLYDQGIAIPDGDGQKIDESSLTTTESRFFIGLNSITRKLGANEIPIKNDIVLIHYLKSSAHIGVMVDSQNMLHSAIGQTSEICQVSFFGHKILGFWRLGG
jgi:hypothetical protein